MSNLVYDVLTAHGDTARWNADWFLSFERLPEEMWEVDDRPPADSESKHSELLRLTPRIAGAIFSEPADPDSLIDVDARFDVEVYSDRARFIAYWGEWVDETGDSLVYAGMPGLPYVSRVARIMKIDAGTTVLTLLVYDFPEARSKIGETAFLSVNVVDAPWPGNSSFMDAAGPRELPDGEPVTSSRTYLVRPSRADRDRLPF